MIRYAIYDESTCRSIGRIARRLGWLDIASRGLKLVIASLIGLSVGLLVVNELTGLFNLLCLGILLSAGLLLAIFLLAQRAASQLKTLYASTKSIDIPEERRSEAEHLCRLLFQAWTVASPDEFEELLANHQWGMRHLNSGQMQTFLNVILAYERWMRQHQPVQPLFLEDDI